MSTSNTQQISSQSYRRPNNEQRQGGGEVKITYNVNRMAEVTEAKKELFQKLKQSRTNLNAFNDQLAQVL